MFISEIMGKVDSKMFKGVKTIIIMNKDTNEVYYNNTLLKYMEDLKEGSVIDNLVCTFTFSSCAIVFYI